MGESEEDSKNQESLPQDVEMIDAEAHNPTLENEPLEIPDESNAEGQELHSQVEEVSEEVVPDQEKTAAGLDLSEEPQVIQSETIPDEPVDPESAEEVVEGLDGEDVPAITVNEREEIQSESVAEPQVEEPVEEPEVVEPAEQPQVEPQDDVPQIEEPTVTEVRAEEIEEPLQQERTEEGAPDNMDEDQDPNTSVTLNPPSSAQNFATPLKSLPPLKDIEPITTPKAFNVAKDDEAVRSSPVAEQRSSNLAELAEQDDVLDHTANDTFASAVMDTNNNDGTTTDTKLHSDLEPVASFLGLDSSMLGKLPPIIISKLVNKTQQFHGLQSELSFFKLNQELFSQVQQKKLDTFQSKIEKLTETNANITLENEVQYDELVTLKETLTAVRNENSTLADKALQLESKLKEWESKYNELANSKETSSLQLNEALDKAIKSNLELGQKLSEINKELSEAVNDKFNFKLELNKANNELVYTRNQKEWYEKELKSLQDKYTSLLKKHDADSLRDSNQISSLTSKNETLASIKDSLQAQVKELDSKLEQQTNKVFELESRLEVQRSKFTKDGSLKDDLIELLNVQLNEKASRILTLETYAEELKSTTSESISNLQREIYEKDDKLAQIEEKLRRTEDALDSELHKETELPKLSTSAELIMQNKPHGISLSSLYTEFNHMKKELVLEKSQKEKLAAQLQHFVAELESKKPAIASYRNQIQFYEQSLKDMLGKLEALRLDKLDSDKEVNRLRTRLGNYESELQSLKQLSKDLGRQLCYYLIHSKVRDGNENPLTSEERKTIDLILTKSGNKDANGESDTDQLITERLVGFASIIELQLKNKELLVAVRLLGKQLEAKEQETEGLESAAVDEAREAILTLQGELDSVNTKLEAVTKERDLVKSLGDTTSQNGTDNNKVEVRLLTEANQELKAKLKESEESLKSVQSQSSEKIKSLMERLTQSNSAYEEVQTKLSSANHSASLAENRYENVKKLLENTTREVESSNREVTFWKEQASKQETLLVRKSNELRDIERKLAETKSVSENLRSEKEVWEAIQKSLKDEVAQLKRDKDQLNAFVSNLQSLFKERELSGLELSKRLSQSIENYQALQSKLSQKDEKIEILSSQSEMALKAQNAKLEQVNELSQKLVDAKLKIAEKETLIKTLRDQIANASKARPSRTLDTAAASENGSSSEYDDIKFELKQAEAQVTEFSNIARAAEDALMKATESFDKYKETADEKLESAEKEKQALLSELEAQKKEIDDLQKKLYNDQSEHLNAVQELKAKLHEYSLKASSYDELKQEYEQKFAGLSDDLASQAQANDALDKKFQAKFTEVEALNNELASQKEIYLTLLQKVEDLTVKLENASTELSSKESVVSEEQSKNLEELEATKAKLSDLQYQFNLTLNQLELSKFGNQADGEAGEDLKEVVNYLRREKDVAESRVNHLLEEKQRLEVQVDTVSAELGAARSQLNRLLNTKVQLDESTKEHARLLEQLEQLNILRESNVTLRNENRASLETVENLRKEIEQLKSAKSSDPVVPVADDSSSSVQEQDLRLLKEENERLKNQLENNEEMKKLLAKFDALKNEFRSKLIAHRDKNRELERELNELRGTHESTSKQLSELQSQLTSGGDENLNVLREQLNKAETAKQEADKKFETEVTKLKEQHEAQKNTLKTQLQTQFDVKLAAELSKAKSAAAKEGGSPGLSEAEILQKIDQELRARVEAATRELTSKFERELEGKVEQRVQERLASQSTDKFSSQEKAELSKFYEDKIQELTSNIDERLEEERSKLEQSIETKYLFKLRVLNRKLEKYEGTEGSTGDSQANEKPSIAKPAQVSGRSTPTYNSPHGESTLSVIQPNTSGRNGGQQSVTFPQSQSQGQLGPQRGGYQGSSQGHTYTKKRSFQPQTGNTYKKPRDDKE